MRGALEATTRENLKRSLAELIGIEGGVINVNDKKLAAPMRVRLRMEGVDIMDSA
jgi:hypothetical protein